MRTLGDGCSCNPRCCSPTRSTHVFDMQGVPIQASIDACPVDCIHWVDKEQLPALEHVMQKRMGRTNVGVMMAGQGVSNGDVFALTDRFLKERDARCGYIPVPLHKCTFIKHLGMSPNGGTWDMSMRDKCYRTASKMCPTRHRPCNCSCLNLMKVVNNSYLVSSVPRQAGNFTEGGHVLWLPDSREVYTSKFLRLYTARVAGGNN